MRTATAMLSVDWFSFATPFMEALQDLDSVTTATDIVIVQWMDGVLVVASSSSEASSVHF